MVDRGLQRFGGAEALRPGVYDFRYIDTIETLEHGCHIVRRAVLVVAGTGDDMESRGIHGLHLVRGHADIHLEERLIVRFYRQHL